MPHIQKIKTGPGIAHRVHWSVDGVRNSKYFPPRIPYRTVKHFADTIIAQDDQPQTEHIHLGELLARYTIARAKEHDAWREAVAMRHLIRYAGDIFAHRVTPDLLHRFRDALYDQRARGRTEYADEQKVKRGVNHDLRHIRVVLRWAYRRGILPAPVFDRVELFKAAAPRPDVLTPDELNRMRLALGKQDRMIFHLLRFTGLRIGEACALDVKDIDVPNMTIRLTRTKNRDQIDIPIDRRLARIWKHTKWLERDGLLIPYKPDTIARHFRAAMERAGIKKKMPTHIFRHTAGRRIMERYFTTGNAQEIARRFLRHKTRVMTDHYAKVYTEDIGRAMDDVDL